MKMLMLLFLMMLSFSAFSTDLTQGPKGDDKNVCRMAKLAAGFMSGLRAVMPAGLSGSTTVQVTGKKAAGGIDKRYRKARRFASGIDISF